jgi:hypothetical protein
VTVADRIGTSLSLLALTWVLRNPAVSVALSGCRTPHEIEQNVRALDVSLDTNTLAQIDRMNTAEPIGPGPRPTLHARAIRIAARQLATTQSPLGCSGTRCMTPDMTEPLSVSTTVTRFPSGERNSS